MTEDDDTRELARGEPTESQAAEPGLGPWGADAVRLGADERDREPTESGDPRPQRQSQAWIARAAIVGGAGLAAVLGAIILGDGPTAQTDGPNSQKKIGRRPAIERQTHSAGAGRRPKPRERVVRRRAPRSRPAAKRSRPTPPAPTYAPTPATAPAPEPVTPSPAPAPAPEPPPTTKPPPPASGATVAEEFGFER